MLQILPFNSAFIDTSFTSMDTGHTHVHTPQAIVKCTSWEWEENLIRFTLLWHTASSMVTFIMLFCYLLPYATLLDSCKYEIYQRGKRQNLFFFSFHLLKWMSGVYMISGTLLFKTVVKYWATWHYALQYLVTYISPTDCSNCSEHDSGWL